MRAEAARHPLSIDYRAAGGGLGADVRTLVFQGAEFPEVAENRHSAYPTKASGSNDAYRLTLSRLIRICGTVQVAHQGDAYAIEFDSVFCRVEGP